MRILLAGLILLHALIAAAAPVRTETNPPATPAPPAISATSADTTSLYTRLGGETGIARLVDTTIRRILADSQLTPYFKSATPQSISYARKVAINHLCSEADGPCWSFFSSRMLAMVVELNQPLWQRLRGHVVEAMTANKLAERSAHETLAIVDRIGQDLLHPAADSSPSGK